ncbi:restriction endonuclease subunit S [Rhizobium ruizarguesonis]
MSEWPTIELGQLAEFRNGLNYSAANNGVGLAVVGVSDFQDKSFVDFPSLAEVDPSALSTSDALIQKNDILFVRSNGNRELIGRSLLVLSDPHKPTSHSGFTIRLRFTDRRADPRFFAYFLRSSAVRRHLSSQGGGTNINNLNQAILSGLTVPLPPFASQQRIASILGAYDDLIEVNRRRIAVLEKMARGLFEEWFVRFRFPGHEEVPILDTPDGPLPKGWQRVSFGTVAENFDRLRKPLSGQQRLGMGGRYPYYGAAKVFDYIDSYIFEGLYLLIAEDGSVITPDGFPVLQLADGKFWVNNHAHVVKGRGEVTTEYLYLALGRQPIQGYITGAAQPKITQANLNRIVVTVAEKGLLAQFSTSASALVSLALSLRQINGHLAASRDLLLPRLTSGELSVMQAERELEEAA